jgi:hypothetical protein
MRELPLVAESYGREPAQLLARVADYERGARVRRALAIGLPLFGLALVSVPIPGWHVAAVPGFAIAAVVLARRRLRQAYEIESVFGSCPACGLEQPYPVPGAAVFPATLPCPACGEFLKLSELR